MYKIQHHSVWSQKTVLKWGFTIDLNESQRVLILQKINKWVKQLVLGHQQASGKIKENVLMH